MWTAGRPQGIAGHWAKGSLLYKIQLRIKSMLNKNPTTNLYPPTPAQLFITILKLVHSNLYWTDWNREAPKIETSSLDGENRRILINKDIGLPNGLTFDPFSKLLCWADAGNTGDVEELSLPYGKQREHYWDVTANQVLPSFSICWSKFLTVQNIPDL